MFVRVRGKWIIQAAVQLCQFRISFKFNGGKTSLGNFFNCLSLLCSVISQGDLHGGISIERNFKKSRVWLPIWASSDVVNGNFVLNSFGKFMKFQEWLKKISSFRNSSEVFYGLKSFPTSTLQTPFIFSLTLF